MQNVMVMRPARFRTDFYTNKLDWVDWFESIHFFRKSIELIQFLFQASWLVIESIRFYKVSDWVDWPRIADMIDSIQLIKNAKKRSTKSKVFRKKV